MSAISFRKVRVCQRSNNRTVDFDATHLQQGCRHHGKGFLIAILIIRAAVAADEYYHVGYRCCRKFSLVWILIRPQSVAFFTRPLPLQTLHRAG